MVSSAVFVGKAVAMKTVVPQLRWVSPLLSFPSADRIGISELGFDLGFVCRRLRALRC